MSLLILALGCGGSSWQKQGLPAPSNPYFSSLSAIWAFSDSDVWVGGARTLHFDGSQWTDVGLPGGTDAVTDFWGLAPDDLWAVASSKVYRWQGSTWTEVPLAVTNVPDLQAIWVQSETDFAIGGGVVNAEMLRFVNGTWTRKYAGVTDLWGSGSVDVWAVAEGDGFWRWTGTDWNEVPGAATAAGGARPLGVFGTGADDVWAAGESNTLQHWDGAQWTSTETEDDLATVWAAAPDDVWAAGDDGVVTHFNGAQWTRQSVGFGVSFTKLSGASAKSVWAVGHELSTSGNHGVVYRYRP